MSKADLDLHPACAALPELSPERFAEMVESIREHGQEDPIVVHDGQVLDGRHRLRACAEAGVEPRFEEWDGRGGSPVGFIALKQIRRDMTKSQRAMWAAEHVLPAEEQKAAERKEATQIRDGAPPDGPGNSSGTGEARDRAGEAAGVSGRSVGEAKKLRDSNAALTDEVRAGRLSLAEAARRQKIAERIARFPEDERDRAAGFLKDVTDAGNHTAKVIELADNLLAKPEEERVRIYVLHESEGARDRSLALTEAAGLPPMPHPALAHLRDAGRAVARAARHMDDPSDAVRLDGLRAEISDIVSSLKEHAA